MARWTDLQLRPLVLLGALPAVLAYPPSYYTVIKSADNLLPSYDYVVVGGGNSGLVVANRLSENPRTQALFWT